MDNFRGKRSFLLKALIAHGVDYSWRRLDGCLFGWGFSELASLQIYLGYWFMKRSILGMVLSGGKSRRLGQDKAQLSFHEGTNQLDYMLSLLDTFCESLAISCRGSQFDERSSRYDAPLILDAEGLSGPVAGVLSGLKYAENRAVLAVACDMPLLDAVVLLKLLSLRNPEKLATCFIAGDGRPEPMCAVYEAACLPVLEKWIENGNFSLRRFLEVSDVALIEFDEPQLLASVNTFEDVKATRDRLAR